MPLSPPLQKVVGDFFEQPEIETPKGIVKSNRTANVTNRRIEPPRPTRTQAERSHRKQIVRTLIGRSNNHFASCQDRLPSPNITEPGADHSLLRRHLRLEPVQRPLQHVSSMFRRTECMSFVRIDDQLSLYTLSTQRMPELEALRSRALAVAISYYDQRRRLYVLDVFDRRTLRVHRRIVVHGLAEEWHHPLVDRVLPVVALPIADARAGHRRLEPRSPRYTEHRHKSAIAPARQALAVLINREAFLQHVHPSQN